MFGIIPKPLWTRHLAADDRNRIPLCMRCLLLEGAGRLALIDTGVGHKYDARFADLYAVDHGGDTLDQSLAALGFHRSDITDVILTHLHFDHAGGATERSGETLQVAFPKAQFHVQRAHWAWAENPNPREQASFLQENLAPLAASGQVHLIDGAGPLWPGVELLTVDGHTEAQQLVKLSGPEGVLLYAADLLPTSHHLAGPWVMAYDVRPLVTMAEKQALLTTAYEEGWRVFFEHDPAVEVASLMRDARGRILATEPRPLEGL